MENKPVKNLPVWMNKGEPLTLAHAASVWWDRVYSWLAFPLAQIDVDTCDERLLALLAFQRDIERFPGESSELLRLRVKYAYVNARDSGSKAGFEQIFDRLGIGTIQQLERQMQYDWDVILIRISDEQLSRDNALMMRLVRQYGRTCRRYFFDVLNNAPVTIYGGEFSNETRYYSARAVMHPVSITADPTELNLAPQDVRIVHVEILPEDAEDRSFTVQSSDPSVASVKISGGVVIVTGHVRGAAVITVTTNDRGLTAVINVRVVAVLKFVAEIENPDRGLFFVRKSDDFTIDYGDGIDSREYRFHSVSDIFAWVIPTRALETGKQYTITVKNSETASLRTRYSNVSTTLNPVRELISVTGERGTLNSFASECKGLVKIHKGAFDDLPNVESCSSIFRQCTSLADVPASLFARLTLTADFSNAFYGCTSLPAVPPGFFAGLAHVTTCASVFEGCTALRTIGSGAFRDCGAATTFSSAFNGCAALEAIGAGALTGCVAAKNFNSMFKGCSLLLSIPADLFSNVQGGDFSYVFQSCYALAALPPALFRQCVGATTFTGAFSGCRSLAVVPAAFFAGLSGVIAFNTVFSGCTALVVVEDGIFAGCENARQFGGAFHGCVSLESVGDNIFSGCVNASSFSYLFYSCSALRRLPLFAEYCQRAVAFDRAFYQCTALEELRDRAFASLDLVSSFSYAFWGCSSLTRIGEEAFGGCSSVTNMLEMFRGCASLVELAPDMFSGCVKVSNVQRLFADCSSLRELPAGLFHDFVSVTTQFGTFEYCTALAIVPVDLFAGSPNLVAVPITFYGCSALASVPGGLFAFNHLITAFSTTFGYSGLESIPAELFAQNLNVTQFPQTFRNCRQLRSVPAGLFAHNAAATMFNYAFINCSRLETVGAGLFNHTAASAIAYLFSGCAMLRSDVNGIFNLDFYPLLRAMQYAFSECASLTGKGRMFIDKAPGVTNHISTFYSCVALDDYDQLPETWKEVA